jgi:hypothetical protein
MGAMPEAVSSAPTPDPAKRDVPPSRIGKLIVRYPTFLSSLVVGIAGLIATTMWQCRNYHSQRDAAAAAQKVTETQAANSWKIERTEILGKNLQTLAQTGPGTADQRFGVLLSLTRAEIIDPELAVSYALELGKDNVEYMQSVLASTPNKNYTRIERAYTVSCEERYGVSPAIDACTDKLEARSQGLAELVSDEVAATLGTDQVGPLVLFKDERRTQLDVQTLCGLFEATLLGMYDRRQWDELDKFAATSPGAHLVSSLVLAAAHTGEFVTDDDAKTLAQFHSVQTKWLSTYLASKPCDADCKGHMIEVMVTHFAEAEGSYDTVMRTLFESSRAQSGIAISRLHARLLWCQVDDSDVAPLRDHVLVPAAADLLRPGADAAARDAVLGLLALVAEPPAGDAPWASLISQLDRGELGKAFKDHHALALHQRAAPPPAMRRTSFCSAPAHAGSGSGSGS